MKKKYGVRALSILLAILVLTSSMIPLALPVQAEEAQPGGSEPAAVESMDDMSSEEAARAWGFTTNQTEESVDRQNTGVNPLKGHEDNINTFGDVPLEIAVVGSRVSPDLDDHGQDNADRNDIYYYDHIKRDPTDNRNLTMSAPSGTTGHYEDVDGITSEGESDVRPSATVAADMNGDGIDEIVRYYVDISYSGSDSSKKDGDIKSFNSGVEDYKAEFFLEVIDSQTGARITGKDTGRMLTVRKEDTPRFFIPDSIYYWPSYMQLTVGDYNNDGKKEVALLLPDTSSSSTENLCILSLNGKNLEKKYTLDCSVNSSNGSGSDVKFSAYRLTTGDCDNDGVDELVFSNTKDVITQDNPSYIHVIDYKDSVFTQPVDLPIVTGSTAGSTDAMGNAGVTVGDINNDGFNEIVVGGFMVNDRNKGATYTYSDKNGNGTKVIPYYHEMAMAYMKYDNVSNTYSPFQGFSVFREEEKTAQTCEDGNDTSYRTYSTDDKDRQLNNSRRYRNSSDWTIPIQAVSLTGNVNNKANDQIFFGNYLYYFNGANARFEVYDSDGEVDVDSDPVVYHKIQAPTTAIMTLVPGSFLSDEHDGDSTYVPVPGKQQLLVSSVRKSNGGTRTFEIQLLYEKDGDSMKPQRSSKYIANAEDGDFNDMKFYPTVCAPNMDHDTMFVQYLGHDFTYTKPEVLNVIASVPYYQDIMDEYPVGVWGNPGTTYFKRTKGGSSTNTGFTDISLGWYFNFHQDVSVLGIRLFSIEAETSASVNTSFEFSKTIERSSSIQYETSEGQDSVVMITSPLDIYQYRYFQETAEYKKAYPAAVKDNPGTWGVMEASLPGKPSTKVFAVSRFNELADKYGMKRIDGSFWTHTSGEPGTYPTSTKQFINASDIKTSDDKVSATTGGSAMNTELEITESEEAAYTISMTMGAKVGAGAGGLVMGTTFESTTGFGNSKISFSGTTIGATLNGFPDPEKYHSDLDTKAYGLTTWLHSYTTTYEDKKIIVQEFTVEEYYGLPRRVENFRSTGSKEGEIDLAWDIPSVISPKLRPNKYVLERYDPYYKKWVTVVDGLPAKDGTNTYADTDVYAGESYQYRITSSDGNGTIKNAVELTASTPQPGMAPPEITKQPESVTTGTGGSASFTVSAKIPDGSSPTRIYYQWYQRANSSAGWESIPDAIDKTLSISTVTIDMNGYQYCCDVTRLGDNGVHLTARSDYAELKVLDHTPKQYSVDFTADKNGSVIAETISGSTSTPILSGTSLPETSNIRFTATAAPGYYISQWILNGEVVSGSTSNTLVVNNLSRRTSVQVVFSLSVFSFYYREEQWQHENESWGTVSAECNGNPLPVSESTTLVGSSRITLKATPKEGYIVDHWSVTHRDVSNNYTNELILDSLSENTLVTVSFKKMNKFKITVGSAVVNTDAAYRDDSGYSIYVNGSPIQPGTEIIENSKVDITATGLNSAIVDSWTLKAVDGNGKETGLRYTAGSQSAYTIDRLTSSWKVTINYRIISTKKVDYSLQGGGGTMTAQVVGNTSPSGIVQSGSQVQMYADVAFNVAPAAGSLGVSGWSVNGVLESGNSPSKVVRADRNLVVKAVIETLPTAKSPAYQVSMLADSTFSLTGGAIAEDMDGDTLSVVAIESDVLPDTSVAKAELGSGADSSKLLITGVNEGTTSVKVKVSDDNGNTVDVVVPITVTNNQQAAPVLTGVMNTCAGIDNAKITGLDKNKTYAYKLSDAADYQTVSGQTEITGLKPGEYMIYYTAVTGYLESPKARVYIETNYFAGGNGEAGTPFQITTPSMLDKVRKYDGKCFILMNDLDMTEYLSVAGDGYDGGKGFLPIGMQADNNYTSEFNGTFDGNGKVIKGLRIRRQAKYQGLFSQLYRLSTVKNLGLEVEMYSDNDCVGGIAGINRGTISGCYVTGSITSGQNGAYFGGLTGQNYGTVENCYSTAILKGYNYFGGLVGELFSGGIIKNSYSVGETSYNTSVVGAENGGGLAGKIDPGAQIMNSYFDYKKLGSWGTFETTGASMPQDLLKISHYKDWDFTDTWSMVDGESIPTLQAPRLVTMVTLNKTEAALTVGESETLTAFASPDNAANRNIGWSSSDPLVAAVDAAGRVTALKAGTAEITASSCDGTNIVSKCVVTVTDPAQTTFEVVFKDWDGTVLKTQTVNDGTAATAPGNPSRMGYTFTGWDAAFNNVTGDLTVTAQYNQELAILQSIAITAPARKLVYTVGEALDIRGMVVTGTYSDHSTKAETVAAANVTGFDSSAQAANQVLTVTVDGKTTTYTVTINAASPANTAPVRKTSVVAAATASVTVNTAYTLSLATIFEDADTNILTYKVSVNGGADIPSAANYTYTPVATGTTTLVFKANDGMVDSTDTYTVMLTANPATPITAYTVTFNSNSSVYATKTVNAGESLGSAAWPADPTRSSYTFGGWFTGENGADSQFTSLVPVDATMTVYAKWTYNGGDGGGGGGLSTPSNPTNLGYTADIANGNGSKPTIPVTVDKGTRNASVDAGPQSLTEDGTVITVPSIPNVDTYSVGILVPKLSTSDIQGKLTVNTDAGNVTVPSNMLTGVAGISGSKAQISIGKGDKSNLTNDVKAIIGDRPLIQLTVTIDGKKFEWNNPNAPVTVSIPYKPASSELNNPESIVVWYIDGSGKAVSVPNGSYNPATGMVAFATTHFSDYAVGYNPVSFNDVAEGAWYNKAVGFIAARGITTGTGSENFSPEARLTRGEFIVMMMRGYGIAPDTALANNFSDAGNTYYTGYLAAAKQLGISGGVGNNMFAPGKAITRQEMFTMLYNALKVIDRLPQGNSGKSLSSFRDAGQIASWAKDAMTLMVETGTVGGNNGMLTPISTATRAEMAQVLYNLLLTK